MIHIKSIIKIIREIITEELVPSKEDFRKIWRNLKYIASDLSNNDLLHRNMSYDLKIIKFVILPLFAGLIAFVFVRPSFAQFLDTEESLAQYLASGGNVSVGTEVVEGKSRGFYLYNGGKTYVTPEGENALQLVSDGEYIAYSREVNSRGQIFLYNIPTQKTIQLTFDSNNLNPAVGRTGNVVWEGWTQTRDAEGNLVSETWHLFVYDGKVIRQITQGDMATHADIEGNFIVYARRNKDGLWRSEAYSIADNKTADIDVGNDNEYPRLDYGTIYVGPPQESQKRYPLKVADLFLLELPSMAETSGREVTVESILSQLEEAESTASSSAISNF